MDESAYVESIKNNLIKELVKPMNGEAPDSEYMKDVTSDLTYRLRDVEAKIESLEETKNNSSRDCRTN